MKKILFIIGIIAIIILSGYTIYVAQKPMIDPGPERISIVTTLFPQYNFAKIVGGSRANVTLLLPPGVEAHAFEPTPSDIIKINKADIFVYTGKFMEPWAYDLIKGIDEGVRVVDTSTGIKLIEKEEKDYHQEEKKDHHDNGIDPHIWLNFANAKIMAENIAQVLSEIDPENTNYFQGNLGRLQRQLSQLDNKYKDVLANCRTRTIVFGGHYAFGYLAKRYNLRHVAAQGFSPKAEPTAQDLITIIKQIRRENVNYIFYEELASPRIAEILAAETGIKLLSLNPAHNLSKEDFLAGASFTSIMEENLKNLSIGLECL